MNHYDEESRPNLDGEIRQVSPEDQGIFSTKLKRIFLLQLLLSALAVAFFATSSTEWNTARRITSKGQQYLKPNKKRVVKKQRQRDEKNNSTTPFFVEENDFSWVNSPIVVESHSLIFFYIPKNGCTVFKQLLRRIMGYDNWRAHGGGLPHKQSANGLKYLIDYSPEEATRMMMDPKWTRTVFVRNPKERILSAFLDKGLGNNGSFLKTRCCPTCTADTLDGFIEVISRYCKRNPHWSPQWYRMKEKYWHLMDFVGNFDNVHIETKELLQKIGAWEEFGKSGWGDGAEEIFSASKTKHATGAHELYSKYFTPEVEEKVRLMYAVDYDNDVYSSFFTDKSTTAV